MCVGGCPLPRVLLFTLRRVSVPNKWARVQTEVDGRVGPTAAGFVQVPQLQCACVCGAQFLSFLGGVMASRVTGAWHSQTSCTSFRNFSVGCQDTCQTPTPRPTHPPLPCQTLRPTVPLTCNPHICPYMLFSCSVSMFLLGFLMLILFAHAGDQGLPGVGSQQQPAGGWHHDRDHRGGGSLAAAAAGRAAGRWLQLLRCSLITP